MAKRHLGKLHSLQFVQNQDIMTSSRSSFLIWQNKPNQIDRRNLAKQSRPRAINLPFLPISWQNQNSGKGSAPLLLMHYWHLRAQPEQIQNRDRCGIVGTGIHLWPAFDVIALWAELTALALLWSPIPHDILVMFPILAILALKFR